MKLASLRLCAIAVGAVWTVSSVSAWAANNPTGRGPCKGADDCARGVCVEVNNDSYCSQPCGSCPAGLYCDEQLFGMWDLKVCVKGSSEEPVKPEQAPARLPCKADRDCQSGLICAEMMGHRDCTLPCATDAQCKMPELAGVKFDFFACQVDGAKRERKACLPKKACVANPMACMTVNPATMGAMMGGVAGMADEMESAAESSSASASPRATAVRENAAMPEGRFAKLVEQVKGESFEDERNAVIETAAKNNYFTCEQVSRLLDVIAMGDEKIAALRILAPKLTDREDSHTVLAHFKFDDEKEQAKRILAR